MRLPFPRSSPPPPLARSPRVGAFGWIPSAATAATATAAATALLLFVRAGTASGLSPDQAAASYAEARRVRALEGPSAAVALYRSLLDRYPGDATAAARIAADPYQASKHDRLGRGGSPRERREATRFLQESFGFERESVAGLVFAGPVPGNGNGNGNGIGDDNGNGKCGHESQGPTLDHRLFRALRSSAPLYLKARGAGTVVPPLPATPLEACVQLFLMGVSLPTETCEELLSRRFVELAETLGLAFTTGGGGAEAEAGAEASGERAPDPAGSWFVPYAHVFPVSIGDKTLYLATDLHPTVLSSTTVGGSGSTPGGSGGSMEDGAVMYIGPDSLALIDHWTSLQQLEGDEGILDIGCGSGIQALGLVAQLSGGEGTKPVVKCVDINQRALRVTKLNFEWNNFDAPTLIHGDINQPSARILLDNGEAGKPIPWTELLGKSSATYMVSNPPFLPVPVHDPAIASRYGLFSSGGSTGEEFFESLVRLASDVLDQQDPSATLAIVSEFMNPSGDFADRLSSWWKTDVGGGSARALLLTNEKALDAAEYAKRRADNDKEAKQWEGHLGNNAIEFISPGLMFLRRNQRKSNLTGDNTTTAVDLKHVVVPKTREGSIWTPTNIVGRNFTSRHIQKFASEWNTVPPDTVHDGDGRQAITKH